jgi:hypothetical protein
MPLTIEAKMIGKKQNLFSGWAIPLPPDSRGGNQLTLRDLITRVVHEEVAAFQSRQEERRLERVLSPQQITDGAAKGKIDMGGRDLQQTVDVNAAVSNALVAFEDGFYYVFIDDQQIEGLDTPVYVNEQSVMTFIRLVPLVGG